MFVGDFCGRVCRLTSRSCAAHAGWLTMRACPPLRLAPPCRERVWQRYVDDELFNRDSPPMVRPRTQRKRRLAAAGGGEGGEAAAAAGMQRPRPPKDDGGLDKAYRRSFLQQDDAKRPRHD